MNELTDTYCSFNVTNRAFARPCAVVSQKSRFSQHLGDVSKIMEVDRVHVVWDVLSHVSVPLFKTSIKRS